MWEVDHRARHAARHAARVAAALLTAALGACGGAEPAAVRPNVLVLMADDQAAGTLSCTGHPFLETPALDRIAREGVLFTNAFVTTSLCSPSRASYLTGQWARTHGVLTNSQSLAPEALTFATILSAQGYETAYFGKWHMGTQSGPRPGFERNCGYDGQGQYRDCPFVVDGRRVATRGHVDDVATDFLIEYLAEPRTRPFAAVLGFKAPHGPREPAERTAHLFVDALIEPPQSVDHFPPFPHKQEWEALAAAAGEELGRHDPPERWAELVERTRAPGWFGDPQRERLRNYWRLIRGLDDNVGRILEALDDLDLAQDTILVYASDNGFANGEHGISGKLTAYEESMRTVLAIRYPALGGATGPLAQLALNVDLAPTLLELCGAPVPVAMQGRSLAPLLAGEQVPWRRDFLYEYFRESTHLPGAFAAPFPTLLAVRTEGSKLIIYPGYPSWTEYFRLERDPFELQDAAEDPAAAAEVAALRERLAALEAELGARPVEAPH